MVSPVEHGGQANKAGSRIAIVMSPSAGQEPVLRNWVRERRREGDTVLPLWAWEPDDADRFGQLLHTQNPDRVLIAGGDGAIHHTAGGLLRAGYKGVVGVIPMGTGNDLARTLKLPLNDLRLALKTARTGKPRPIDYGEVEGRSFFNMMTVGTGAEITNATDGLKDLGALGYSLKGLSMVFAAEPFGVLAQWEDGEWEGRIWSLCIGNGAYSGGGLGLCPSARLNDGLLDLVCLNGDSLGEVAQNLLADWRREGDSSFIRVQRPEFRIQFTKPVAINLDGEAWEQGRTTLEVKARGSSLEFVEGESDEPRS